MNYPVSTRSVGSRSVRQVTAPSALSRPRCRSVTSRATGKQDDSPARSKKEVNTAVQKAVDAMKKDGVDERVARKVLQAWQAGDVKDPSGLRKRMLGLGVSVVALSALQLGTDILASYCSNVTAVIVDQQSFAGHGILAIVFQALFYYFLISAAFDVFRLGAVIGGTLVLGTRASTLYEAIETLAGEKTGIALVDKAQAAFSASKVAIALNSVRTALQDESKQLGGDAASGLGAYFVLRHAEEKYGWTAEKAGVSQDDAGRAAALFAKFDANEDNRLEFSEFRQLCAKADFDVSDEEAKAAVAVLDKRGSGYIEFDEFMSWWVDATGVGSEAVESANSAGNTKSAV